MVGKVTNWLLFRFALPENVTARIGQRRNEILEAMGRRRKVGKYPTFNGGTMPPLKTTVDIAKEVGLSERSAVQ